VGGLILTPHIVYHGFDGEDPLDVKMGGGEGIFGIGSVCRGGGIQRESKLAYGVRNVFENRLSRGSFPTVRATAVRRNAVLAGDPKGLDYYVILI